MTKCFPIVSLNCYPVIEGKISKSTFSGFLIKNLDCRARWLMPVIPELWEAEGRWWPEVRSSRPVWPTWRSPVSTKITKISHVCRHMPIVPATREAEAWELLEPERGRLQWAEILSLRSSLSDRARLCLKKEKKKALRNVGVEINFLNTIKGILKKKI